MKKGNLFASILLLCVFLFCGATQCPFSTNIDPIAIASVTPTTGTTNTLFRFNASGSSDSEDKLEDLKFYWQIVDEDDNDIVFHNTSQRDFSIKLEKTGDYEAQLQVADSKGLFDTDFVTFIIIPEATGVKAILTVDPEEGYLNETIFSLDASASVDYGHPDETLWFRWDWSSGNGTWDLDWILGNDKISRTFDQIGQNSIDVEVKNGLGETDATWTLVNIFFTNSPCGDDLTIEYEERTYHTVAIGEQCWLKENLNVGNPIAVENQQTNNGTIEKWCYDNNAGNCAIYGGLYQWDEMMEYTTTEGAQGICPVGWHIPSESDWNDLSNFLGGDNPGGRLKATTLWNPPNTGANNETGFTALPGGWCAWGGGDNYLFQGININASFMGSYSTMTHHGGIMLWYSTNAFQSHEDSPLESGRSVRCLKDTP